MTEGILMLPGAVLSASFVESLEARIVMRASASFIAGRVAVSLLTPKLTKFIPYVGWAIMIGTAVYVGYEAYKSTEVDWNKLENGIYDAADLAMFRVGFTMARQQFLATAAGAAAQQAGSKYILIPSEVMPTVGQVDMIGITQFGNSLTWDPAGAKGRRAQAMRGRGTAGPLILPNGTSLRGSWEEYHLRLRTPQSPEPMSTVFHCGNNGSKEGSLRQRRSCRLSGSTTMCWLTCCERPGR